MLYQTIVDYFIQGIEKGSILLGEKLPSLRQVADQFDVSLSTAVEAYRKLELFGYVSVKDRSGYFARLPLVGENNLRPSKKFKSKVSDIEHIDEIVEIYNHTLDREIAPFGVGTPAAGKFPHKMVNKHFMKTLKFHPEVSGSYIFGLGLQELRSELARWVRPWVGVTSRDNILITHGCLEAMNIALSAECSPGDIVAIESPCYFGILQAIHHHGLKALEVRTHPEKGIEPEALEDLAKNNKIKVLVSTPNAQNPLGFSMTDERKKEILRICKKYNITLIEDDLYGEITYKAQRPKSYKYFDKDGIVTHCSSFSKFLGPGLRLGWCIFSNNSNKYLRQKLSLNLSTHSLTQHVAVGVLRNEGLLKVGNELGKYYQSNIQIYSNQLQSILGSKLTLSNPTGSYFLWARVEGLDALEAYERAKRQKISFTPGPLFSATRLYSNYLRINCAHEFSERRHQEVINLCKILAQKTG